MSAATVSRATLAGVGHALRLQDGILIHRGSFITYVHMAETFGESSWT